MLYHKPEPILVLIFAVGFGVLATSVAHAAEPVNIMSLQNPGSTKNHSESWYESLWGVDLAKKIANWKPPITADDGSEGLTLARPFGTRGPAVRVSDSMPESVLRSLRDGGDNGVGVRDDSPDVYLFLEKRW